MRALCLLSIVLLAMAGCATQPRSAGDLSAHVEKHVSEHRYGAALAALENFSGSKANSAQVRQLRDRVAANAARYESQVIAAATKHVEQNNWHAAQLAYREAWRRYPESETLQRAEQNFIQQRDAHIARLRIAQYAEKAQYLPAEIAQLESISAASPGNLDIRRELQQLKEQQQVIAASLLDAGERALAVKNFTAARHYLTLSNNLAGSAAAEDALRQIPRPRKRQPAKTQRKIKPAPVKVAAASPAVVSRPDSNVDTDAELAQALANYRAARQQGQLSAARELLQQALILRPGDNQLRAEANSLDAAIEKQVREKVEKGKYLYSIGEIDAAIDAWQLAATLSPQDQALQQRLERAQKFRTRYEQLKN